MELLGEMLASSKPDETIQLSPALETLARRERYLATEIDGFRYNIGQKYGLLKSQLALALYGKDRDEILSDLLGMVATRPGSLSGMPTAGAGA
jgi:UTP--glucose-1-phosphate uridylyltransferase